MLENWQRSGGVLILGYDMFRTLTTLGKKKTKAKQDIESMVRSLVNPGADLVICDEGHLLKNEDTAISKAMKLVKTKRRIVLTGTPLQNNLKECKIFWLYFFFLPLFIFSFHKSVSVIFSSIIFLALFYMFSANYT